MTFTPDTAAEAERLIAETTPVCEAANRLPTFSEDQRRTNPEWCAVILQSHFRPIEKIARTALPQALALLQAYRERVAELERNLATTLALADEMDEGLREMVLQYGAPHHENCPQDDTCDCPTPRQINKALVLYAAHRKAMETRKESGR